MKKKKNTIPNDYFDNKEFIVDEIDEDLVAGVLGKNPSADQLLKFEFCTYISQLIDRKGMSLTDVEKATGVNPSDVSRIKNHHLDRFTIDRLIKIYSTLDTQHGVSAVLKSVIKKIGKISA
ncbi:MAG: XRE family transcriptional regulator [Bacteriovoracaceae bacterium]|nr:XRE family transcriptional regulator [Bacteriovoracaceae bacterium]